MNASFFLVAVFVCAQAGPPEEPARANPAQNTRAPVENAPPPKPAASKIADVTVYQGQALVTREVNVPEGDGMIELVVTPDFVLLAGEATVYIAGDFVRRM
jgi:hypothetical protein